MSIEFQRLHHKSNINDKDVAQLTARLMEENKEHSRGWYRINAIRSLTGGVKLTTPMNDKTEEVMIRSLYIFFNWEWVWY